MAFLLEGEADETLAAALAFLDEQQKPQDKLCGSKDDLPVLPSLDDPEADEVLDALSAELPPLAEKEVLAEKRGGCAAALAAVAPKFISQRRFKRHQVVPCPPPQSATSSTSDNSSSSPTTSSQKKPYVRKKPLGYNPNKARDERKLELLYLRKKVVDMELELQKLQEIKGSGDSPLLKSNAPTNDLATNQNTHHSDDGVPRVWEKMCARQLKRRVTAERENARLRMVLEGQIKIAKSMEQILRKRTVLRAMESCGSNKRTKHTNRVVRTSDPRADARIFEVLLAGVEASYREVDAVFEANGLGRTEAPKSDAQMHDGVNGMHLEIFANKMLPFGMHATGEAVWQHFKGTDIPYRWYHSKSAGSIESTEDTMVESFGMEMYDANSKTKADFNVKQILRRYVEEDRVVVVWRSHIEPLEFSNKRFAGIHFQEKGYVVIKPRAHNYDSADDDDFTLVQTCYIITPDLSDQTLNDDAKTGALTEFVLNSTAANISASNEMIENVLVDQALQQRKRHE